MYSIGDERKNKGETSHQKVMNALKDAILNGKYNQGDPLIEMKISNELGVSRTPVREAIRQLELEGLVRTVPNCGAVVVGVSNQDIEDIYTIRMCIEGLAARWAATRITSTECEDLKLILEMQEFYLSKEDVEQVLQLDSKFHEIIRGACRSNVLDNTLKSFHEHIKHARRIALERRSRALHSVAEHRNIYDAIHNRDEELSEYNMILHIQNARESFLNETSK